MGERDWIPRLEDLTGYRLIRLNPATLGRIDQQLWEVPAVFVPRWITLHQEDAGLAQDHWEQVVARILGDAAAAGPGFDRYTMRRAVTATITLLEHPEVGGLCFVGRADDHLPPHFLAPHLARQDPVRAGDAGRDGEGESR